MTALSAADGGGRVVRARPKRHAVLAGLAVALIAVALLSLAWGAVEISLGQVLAILAAQIGIDLPWSFDKSQEAVLLSIRLPRAVLGALVGGSLAVAGATLQGLFRNPLADPQLIGVSSGAALAAVTVIVFGAALVGIAPGPLLQFSLPVAAFLGGAVATAIVYRIANLSGRTVVATMLLAGIAIQAIASAGIGVMIFIADDDQLRTLNFWLLGSLAGGTWDVVLPTMLFLVIPLAALPLFARPLNAFLLGESEAGHVGIDVETMKRLLIGLVALAAGAAVAVTGVIGFVGLVVPHILRLLVGPDHRLILPGSILLGGALLIGADLVARTIVAPAELPIGIVTQPSGRPVLHLAAGAQPLAKRPLTMLSAKAATVRIGSATLLTDVSIDVRPGEVVVILGPNGAGKSTLLRLFAGERAPNDGRIELNGRAMQDWPKKAAAKVRAVLPQSSPLSFPFMVREVVMIGRTPHLNGAETDRDRAIVDDAMSAADVTHLADPQLPDIVGR